MSSEQLYRKEGNKYIKIGPADGWSGFPSEGLWLVTNKPGCKSSSWIAKWSDVPNFEKIASFKMHFDTIIKAINEYFDIKREEWNREKQFFYSARDIADKIISELVLESRNREIVYKKQLLTEKFKDDTIKF